MPSAGETEAAGADAHRLGSLYLPPRPPAPCRIHSPALKGTADTTPDEEIPEAGTLVGKKIGYVCFECH